VVGSSLSHMGVGVVLSTLRVRLGVGLEVRLGVGLGSAPYVTGILVVVIGVGVVVSTLWVGVGVGPLLSHQ
jgi:hypothetical protein